MNSNDEVEEIINNFDLKIKKHLHNTYYQERKDLEQEIKLKIIEKLNDINFEDPPSFWFLINNLS
ncbi:hypothetical protein [Virgibacillus dokdonensis]|uniref:hypothetical protein n=1 Tax=Virgibacillus dokdonensis TaxID=302167 RepID=UPI00269D9C5B